MDRRVLKLTTPEACERFIANAARQLRDDLIEQARRRAVDRSTDTLGFSALAEMGLLDFAFEAVVLRYPDLFSETAVQRSKARMKEWESRDGR